MEEKPTLFIASSTEGYEIAEAVEANLSDDFETVLWKHVFTSGYGNLETLVAEVKKHDFAAVVLSAEDRLTLPAARGGATVPTARDNLWFELGLFTGAIGRERTFFVYCKDDGLKIPSDYAGVTLCGYNKHHKTGNARAEVSPACAPIRQRVKALGARTQSQRYLNPHYERDLPILDTKWKPELIANSKTIIVVTGDNHVAELLDREAAGILRAEIDARGTDPFERAIIMGHFAWLQTKEFENNPLIAVGGSEKALPLKKQIVDDRKALNGHDPFPAGGSGWGAYVQKPGFGPRVALWGKSAVDTRNAVTHWIRDARGLNEFLHVWK